MNISTIWADFIDAWHIKIILAGIFVALFGSYILEMRALAILVVVDCATKIWALSASSGGFRKACAHDIISSRGMKQLIPKSTWYMLLIIMSHQMETFTLFGQIMGYTPVQLTCTYLMLIVAKSILENLRDSGMTSLEPFISFFSNKKKQFEDKASGK